MILHTQRLELRELVHGDFADLAEMLQDSEVMAAYEHTFTDSDVWEWLNRQRRRYAEDGFGLWAVILRETGEMVGQAGLTMQPYGETQVLEIGYLLKRRFWHRGYAREAVAALRDYAFTVLQAQRVYSIIKADNEPSMRVARAIGMEKEREFITRYYNGDMLHYLFGVSQPQPDTGSDLP